MGTLRFRDRFFTPKVAHAIVSPTSIVATGAGAAAGILIGLGPIGAVIGAAAFHGVRVLAAVPRGPRADRIDPFTLSDPWRRLANEALEARAQFAQVVKGIDEGPLQDRLGDISGRVSDGVDECWRVARAGHALARARSRIDVPSIQRELASLPAPTTGTSGSEASSQTLAALRSQLATASRMDTTISDTHDRLRLSCTRLDEAVTRAIELSVASVGDHRIDELGTDVSTVTNDMEALRQAIEVTNQAASPG